MDSPTTPLTLDVPQVEDLSRHFSSFRHDVNGCLALIVAATELIRYNPSVLQRMSGTMVEQPPKIAGKVQEFIRHCERVLGLSPQADGWYSALWKRTNQNTAAPAGPLAFNPDAAKALQSEMMHLGRELAQLGFVISGVRALAAMDPAHGGANLQNVADQFVKAAQRFEAAAQHVDAASGTAEGAGRKLPTGAPSRPVTFTADELALLQRRLTNFQRDMGEHLRPLMELSRLARQDPQQLVPRAGEFAEVSPKISAEMNAFATEFDRAFGIVRTQQAH